MRSKSRYGFWGWIALGMGATVVPRRVDYICESCGEVFDFTTDPAVLEKMI